MNEFELGSILPNYIINSDGEKEPFELDRIRKSLIVDVGLDDQISSEIIEAVVRKIVGLLSLQYKSISTYAVKDFICEELSSRGLDKYKEIYERIEKKKRTKFVLQESFIDQFRDKQPDWGPLGYITYKRTYARPIDEENRTEEFFETIRRVVEGCYSLQKEHCIKLGLPWNEEKARKSAEIMYEKMWNFKFSAPGRGLWVMGTPFIDKHGSMALNNCGFCSTEDIDIKGPMAFQWCMDALMLGVGVGFDTKGAGKVVIQEPAISDKVYKIPDSREGWVKALGKVLDGFFEGKEISHFDYSLIRPAGAPIKGFGGVASGPGPLKEMLEDIQEMLSAKVGQALSSTDIVDIFNLIGKCVVAGNVRRSAEIALGSMDDHEFITMKQDMELSKHHRWASNNSVIATVGIEYSPIVDSIAKNGEPGVLWLENAQKYSRINGEPDYKDKKAKGVNPCGEQTLESFELCCLVETFPSRHDSYDEYQDTLKYAYLYAKSVTLENTHWGFTNAVMGKNRRIGTSQSGIIDAFVKHGRKTMLDWCDRGYNYLKKLDEKYSDWLCIPKSIKITSVKPSGTVSLLPGVSPGIHYPHSEYYIRRIRLSSNSDLIPILKEAGYNIEEDVYSKNAMVAEFPVHEKHFRRSKVEVSMWEQFENAAAYQKYWSDNQVSVTITFRKEEVKDIKYALECYESKLKSVSMLPINDHGYEQAPYEEITREYYEEMTAKLKHLNLKNVSVKAIGEEGCTTDTCELKKEISQITEAISNNENGGIIKVEKDTRFSDLCFDPDQDAGNKHENKNPKN
ncbi:MAG: ribonucleoside-triphosphate reductase, adenosylcobalamin-dependent [Candidatus Lokiarchaeota archaeon]|nr:ribonucleoside-triphosphate reductase, adenosylcobalamin-dependent [Candidatus Lokiarchaeota archaeon]